MLIAHKNAIFGSLENVDSVMIECIRQEAIYPKLNLKKKAKNAIPSWTPSHVQNGIFRCLRFPPLTYHLCLQEGGGDQLGIAM